MMMMAVIRKRRGGKTTKLMEQVLCTNAANCFVVLPTMTMAKYVMQMFRDKLEEAGIDANYLQCANAILLIGKRINFTTLDQLDMKIKGIKDTAVFIDELPMCLELRYGRVEMVTVTGTCHLQTDSYLNLVRDEP